MSTKKSSNLNAFNAGNALTNPPSLEYGSGAAASFDADTTVKS